MNPITLITNLLFFQPLVNLLLVLYALLGRNFVLAIVALTVLIRLLLYPLMAQQQRAARKMQELQPRLQELQKKYGKDREKLAQEQMKLYKEAGVNPLGGCLPLLIQFPILIAVYQAIIHVLALNPIAVIDLAKLLYRFNGFPALATLLPIQSQFLLWDLGRPERIFIPVGGILIPLPLMTLLVILTTWWSQKVMTPPSTDPQTRMTTQLMNLYMPLFFGWISYNLAVGLSVYFIVTNLISVVQFALVTRDWRGALARRLALGRAPVTPSSSSSSSSGPATPAPPARPRRKARSAK
jgi:YidC/Oxa1 family membrane protein insertase